MKIKLIASLLLALSGSAFSAVSAYSAGHGDIGIAYEDGGTGPEFFFHYHLGSTATVDGAIVGNAPDGEEFEPSDITVTVPLSTRLTMPNNAALNNGTGVAAGGSLWILPQNEAPGVPYLGFATEELVPAEWAGGITFALGNVTSPSGNGEFSLWSSGTFGGFDFQFSTNDPSGTVNASNTLIIPVGTHAHYNFGFSEAGTWDIEMTVSGLHNVDGAQTSTRNFSFTVVPEPTSALLVSLGSLVLLRRRRA